MLTLDGDPLVVRAHGSGFALGRSAQLALGREAFLRVNVGWTAAMSNYASWALWSSSKTFNTHTPLCSGQVPYTRPQRT